MADNDAAAYSDLAESMADALEHCLKSGMKLPFVWCAVAVNGGVLVLRFQGPGITPEVVADVTPDGMRLPVNSLIVDREGTALRMVITPDEDVEFYQ
jgi:hypothetical protein